MALRKRLLFAVGLLLILLAVSTAGYRVLGGHSVTFLQALYMAVITAAGVGYSEVVDTSHNPLLRVFNIVVVLVGVALTVYVFSIVAAFLVELESTNPFWRRRMQRKIEQLSDHYIVCGLGDTARYAVEELKQTGTAHVVIELNEPKIKHLREFRPQIFGDLLYVIGDATEEEVLERAGMARAKGIMTALPQDKDNLVVTVLVRQRSPRIRIVARAVDERFAERMIRAGAQATVSPSRIGGLRMASEVIRPHVVNFLDMMLKEQSFRNRVEQVEVAEGSWVGQTLGDINLQRNYNLLVLAIKLKDSDTFSINPPDRLVLSPGSAIIVLGAMDDIRKARERARSPSL